MAKKNNAKSAGGGNAAAKTEKKGKNQISQQQALHLKGPHLLFRCWCPFAIPSSIWSRRLIR